MKSAWIAAHRDGFALNARCDVLAVSVGGYRAWQGGGTADRQGLTDAQLLALIRSIHAELEGAHGSPRRVREWRAQGICASKARVERPMREHGIRGRHTRRYQATTDSKHSLPVAENRLARDFAPSGPNRVWSADIAYLWTDEGWLYLAIVLDLFDREVVDRSPKSRRTADLVDDAPTRGWFRRKPAPGPIHQSDRGSRYASHAFQATLAQYGMICSMSRKGNGWDNAPTESGFDSFKNQRVFGERFATRDAMKATAFEYIEVFYNRKRLHSTLGYTSPVPFLKDWIDPRQGEKQVA